MWLAPSVVARAGISSGVDRAEVGLLQDAPLDARNREVLGDELTVLVSRSDVEEADVLAAHLSGELRAEVDLLRRRVRAQTDPPAEEGLNLRTARAVAGEVEERRAVEEEVAALGKEEREARQVDLTLIDLGLREVGVDGQVCADSRRRVVEEVEPGVGLLLRDATRRARSSDSDVSRPYGLMSRPRPCVTSRMPVTCPAFVIRLSPWLRAHPIQMLSSFLRRTVRWKLNPHVSLLGSKLSVRKGISISIVQPISL